MHEMKSYVGMFVPLLCVLNTGLMGVLDVNFISCFAVIVSYCPLICENLATCGRYMLLICCRMDVLN
jgi:uncharacterized membrane protein YuzA (DUF378 family)